MTNAYLCSSQAEKDIGHITRWSMRHFGERQTRAYMAELKQLCCTLADSPDIGTAFIHDRTGQQYLRHRYVSHMVYYRKRKHDIFIVRILHSRMLPEAHL